MGEILRKSNVHLLGIPEKYECENDNIERSSGKEFFIIHEIYRYRKHNTYQVAYYIETAKLETPQEKKSNPPTKAKQNNRMTWKPKYSGMIFSKC